MKSRKILGVVWDYLVISVGALIYCMGWTSFLIPAGIASGGGTGLCTIIQFASNGRIPVAYSFFVLNAILLIIGFATLGKGFGFKTVYVILLSTVLFDILPRLPLVPNIEDRLIAAVVGGLVEAIGISMTMKKGGSSGGTDIIAMVVNKYWPVSLGKVYLYIDVFVIASVLLVPGKTVNDMIYGYVTMVTFSFVIDALLLGSKSSVQMMIFSSKYKEIADCITKEMHRGVTAFEAVGWYSGNESKVLLVVCRKFEFHEIAAAVKEIDPKAFVSVGGVAEVYGEGFEEIKTGIKKVKKKTSKKEIAEPKS